MAERVVSGVSRYGGRIVQLCDQGADWSPRRTADVIADIQSGEHSYFVATGGSRVRIVVVSRSGGGMYLRTAEDDSRLNNLDLLPGCPPPPSAVPLRVRRDIAQVGQDERDRLLSAIKEATQRIWPNGSSWWKLQDDIHQSTHVHEGPQFLPWHRELVNRFERLLQRIDPGVVLHYWDWQTDPRIATAGRAALLTPEFMGTASGTVTDPFVPPYQLASVRRAVAAGTTRGFVLAEPPTNNDEYVNIGGDAEPLAADDYGTMRRQLERVHNWVHGYIGGTIRNVHSSFRDPFVFLLHSNLDRLWASWQLRARGDSRLALPGLDPEQIYGDERDPNPYVEEQPGGGKSFLPGIREPFEPWDGRGNPPIAPWSSQPEVMDAMHPAVVRPPLYDRYVFPVGCSWAALLLALPMPDGDRIQATITEHAVPVGSVDIVLQARPDMWWKALRIPDGAGSSYLIETEKANTTASVRLPTAAMRGGDEIVLHKAKAFGARRIVYRLRDLSFVPDGSTVRFNWLTT